MTRGIVGVKTAIPFFAIHQEILTHAPTPTPPLYVQTRIIDYR